MRTPRIGLLGDDRGHHSHRELNALAPRLLDELGIAATWLPTDADVEVTAFDGIWLVPGSPYADDDAVIAALHTLRTEGIPLLGTCAGMQYAVLEFLRSELDRRATHAEADGDREDNAVALLACSLYGKAGTVTPVAGSRFATWVEAPFSGMHYCNYAPTAASIAALRDVGVVVGALGEEGEAEVLEFPAHPFYVVSMFQPHIGASQGDPIHPLVRAFAGAVRARADLSAR